MSHFVPSAFSPSDVAAMLALLETTTPYIDLHQQRAYFSFADPTTSPFPPIFVVLRASEDEPFARQAAAAAITILPQLHAHVVNLSVDDDSRETYWLSHMDVDDDEIDLCYIGSVNALWHNLFRKNPAGLWQPIEDER